jgi:hypothetical protein
MPTRKAVKKDGNNHSDLETALTSLIQNQAMLNQNQILFNQQFAQLQMLINQQLAQINTEAREFRKECEERFARIEQLLINHELMLRELPEAIRQKIGFQK